LTQAGCGRIFTDKASGALVDRPQLAAALDYLRPGDTLTVWKLDRLGRSLRHLVDTVTALQQREVGFRSLQENIDTTTATERLMFHVFAALAEFERDLIRERTQAGLAAARARGRLGGRKPVMTAEKLTAARRMYDSQNLPVAEIARVLGVSRATLYRSLGAQRSNYRPEQTVQG
jgi:DNA invertase Pin-like site-specific DNA recombinase